MSLSRKMRNEQRDWKLRLAAMHDAQYEATKALREVLDEQMKAKLNPGQTALTMKLRECEDGLYRPREDDE